MGTCFPYYVSRVWCLSYDRMVCVKYTSMTDKRKVRPVGTGKGYKLSEDIRNQIYEMYFNGPYGHGAIAYKLNIDRSTVRRHVKQLREEFH